MSQKSSPVTFSVVIVNREPERDDEFSLLVKLISGRPDLDQIFINLSHGGKWMITELRFGSPVPSEMSRIVVRHINGPKTLAPDSILEEI